MELSLDQQFINTNEFKKIMGVHRNTVINWLKNGKIKSVSINGHYLIPISEVERLKGVS